MFSLFHLSSIQYVFTICLLEFGAAENVVEILSSILCHLCFKPCNKIVKHWSVIKHFTLVFKVILIKRSTRWEFLLLLRWPSTPSVMPSTRFSTGNDTDLLRCKNRKENIKVLDLYLEWLWMLPLWCHFCLVLFFLFLLF